MKRYINLFLLLSLVCIFSLSCSEESLDVKDESELPLTRSAGDGGYDLLGYGYDEKGAFADAAYAKAKVIEIEKLDRKEPNRVEKGVIGKQYFTNFSGENYTSYARSVSLKFKQSFSVFKLLKTSLNWAFQGDDFGSNRYSYASYDMNIQRRRLTIVSDSRHLAENYVTDIFKEDYKHLAPDKLIKRYGAFVLRDIVLGGKLSVAYRSQINTTGKKRIVEAGMSMGMKAIFNVSLKGNYTASDSSMNRNAKLSYRTIGGDPSVGLISTIDMKENRSRININPWQNSVSLQNAQLIDIREDGLIPLYELVADYDKRYELLNYQIKDVEKTEEMMLKYAIPLHKLSKKLPKIEVVRQGGNKVTIYMPPQKIEKPEATIAFNFKNVVLNSDGTFSVANVKNGIITTLRGQEFYTTASKIKGRLIKNNTKYKIEFELEGPRLYGDNFKFNATNIVNIQEKYSPSLVAGTYIGTFSPIRVGTQNPPPLEKQTVKITKAGSDKINIAIPPFRIKKLDIPGLFSLNLQNIKLNADGTFYAENIPNLHIDMAWGFDYPVSLIDGSFTPIGGGYQLRMKLKSRMNINGVDISFFIKHNGRSQ